MCYLDWNDPKADFEKCESCGSDFGLRCYDPFDADVWDTLIDVVLCEYCYGERSADI